MGRPASPAPNTRRAGTCGWRPLFGRDLRLEEARVGYVTQSLTLNELCERLGEGEVSGGDRFPTAAESFPRAVGRSALGSAQDVVAEVRCPECAKMVSRNVVKGSQQYCRREFLVEE